MKSDAYDVCTKNGVNSPTFCMCFAPEVTKSINILTAPAWVIGLGRGSALDANRVCNNA